ncbi:jg6815, partial [Pararge aegeria aegeria]
SEIGYPTIPLMFCALFLVTLVIIIEPFHNTHVEMQRTHFLVTSLKFYYSDDAGVSNELHLFLRLLELDKVAYSPLGVCRLERPVTVAMFATITTYLVVALTYGPEVKKPSLLDSYTRVGQF